MVARGFRKFLGIPRRLVELVRLFSARRGLRREFLRLSRLLFSAGHRLAPLRCLPPGSCFDHLDQRPRHRGSREVCDRTRDLHPSSRAGTGGDRIVEVAPQSLRPSNAASSTTFQRFWSGTRSRALVVFRLRAMLDGRGRSREPAAQLPARTGHRGSHVDRRLFSAHLRVVGRTGQLAELAHALFLRRCSTHRRTMARVVDDLSRHDHQPLPLERHGSHFDSYAVRDGRRRLPSVGPHRQTPALWHALDRHHRLRHHLRPARSALPHAADHDLQLAARCDHGDDGSRCMATSSEASRATALFRDPRWMDRISLRSNCGDYHERQWPCSEAIATDCIGDRSRWQPGP